MITIEKYSDNFRLCANITCTSPEERQSYNSPGYPAEYEIELYFEFDEIIDGEKYIFSRPVPEEINEAYTDEKILNIYAQEARDDY